MSRRIKTKDKYVSIRVKEIWRNLDGPSKNNEFVELRSDFELSRPKVAQMSGVSLLSILCCASGQFITFNIVVLKYRTVHCLVKNDSRLAPTCIREGRKCFI